MLKNLKKYPHFILLIALIVAGWWAWGKVFHETSLKQPETRVEIKAEDVEKILEINGAKERVNVRFDTSYVSVDYAIDIMGLKLSPRDVTNTLSQLTVYEIKAGCEDFKIIDNQLFIVEPTVTSIEELTTEREILQQTGEWSAVAHKAIDVRTKSMAKRAALDKGILEMAKLNIEQAFSAMKIGVVWTK